MLQLMCPFSYSTLKRVICSRRRNDFLSFSISYAIGTPKKSEPKAAARLLLIGLLVLYILDYYGLIDHFVVFSTFL